MTFKSGFVAILGRPNVGKSTFLNHVMGQKIAIMSDKAQTTRNKIMGIYTTDKEQIVFIDTPGIHKPKTALGDFMVESAYSTLREVDTVLFMVPADEARGKGDDMIIERLKAAKIPVILVVNKIDKVHPDQLLSQIDDFRNQMDFKEIVPISALQGNNVSRLVDILSENLDEGFQYFPSDQITDHPERFLVSEMVREKVLHLTREEIPHSVAVVVDSMKRDEETDKVHPDQLLAQIDDFRNQMDFKEIVPISALQGNNVSRLIDILSENLEEGFQYFPADQITDHPERFLVSEMIREKVLHLTREEIPHSVAVVVDSMKRDEESDKVHIRATIMVERDSQKGIVIGKGGAMLKKIGTMARKDIELMLGDKVFLETWVKVKKNWRDKKLDLADFGYNKKEY